MSDNLRHWSELERTDPAFTKPFTRAGGFRGTDINPTWRLKRMTERFGPVGIGWGMTKPEFTREAAGEGVAVYCTVGIWYMEGGQRSEPVYGVGGDIIAARRRDGGVALDDEAHKKAFTDALGNAMKSLGVAADVFLKLFDDSKYREESAQHFAEQREAAADRRPAPSVSSQPVGNDTWQPVNIPVPAGGLKAWAGLLKGAIDSAPSVAGLNELMANNDGTLQKLQAESEEAFDFLCTRAERRRGTLVGKPKAA